MAWMETLIPLKNLQMVDTAMSFMTIAVHDTLILNENYFQVNISEALRVRPLIDHNEHLPVYAMCSSNFWHARNLIIM